MAFMQLLETLMELLDIYFGFWNGILVVFGRFWGVSWVSFDTLLEAGGWKMAQILGQDDATCRLEMEIPNFH